ncbi:helix-turn-helix domain-containing protein [Actinomadura nitritigenes]|uniref:helix-turn-helix transcriptional regulator n=1 Tax=Actinomadura nitritigenes TaxID=134602 RepID=UPI003D8D123A
MYFVALSGLSEPSLLAQAVCDALGLVEQGGEPAASRLLAGDLGAALERLCRSLRIKRDLGDELGMTLGLEAIAGCLCSGGEYVRAVRLLGAADRMRESTQTAWFGPHHAMLREIHIGRAEEALGERRYRAAFEEGGRLAPAQAIRDALGEPPDPEDPASDGSADGPAPDACPLTERELQVAALVAEGLSNRDIAERLTIAKRTADSHVEHILSKLGFSSRAQIAVWVTEQGVSAQDFPTQDASAGTRLPY